MSRVRSFFLAEAERWLRELRRGVDDAPLDRAALHRAARRLRGNAQMARFGDLAREARSLETLLRAALDRARTEPEDVLRDEVRKAAAKLERGVEAVREGRLREDPKVEVGMEEQAGGAGSGDVVAVETLEYRGRAALDRALSLREPLEDAVVEDRLVGPLLDELFDLIRLGAK